MNALKAAAALLLVTPFDPTLFKENSCLSHFFYGNYQHGSNTLSVLRPDSDCLNTWVSETFAPSAHIREALKPIQQLVWVQEEVIDQSLKEKTRPVNDELEAFLENLSTHEIIIDSESSQKVMDGNPHSGGCYEVLYRSPKAALLSVDHALAMTIDTLLPRFWKSTLLPDEPMPFIPVPATSVKHAEQVLANLKFDPVIASIIGNISIPQLNNDIRFLTGEDGKSGELREANANITVMIQADMLAYREPGEPRQLGLPDIIGSPIVTQLVANMSAIYSPELRVGDLSERVGYDFVQLKSIAKVQFATLLHTAGYKLLDEE
ncbi:hypothetical protein H0H93_006728 [Arthromyces matolae]|nr:hypothetical protein H0H93_006728 [Arthromyces matolae]